MLSTLKCRQIWSDLLPGIIFTLWVTSTLAPCWWTVRRVEPSPLRTRETALISSTPYQRKSTKPPSRTIANHARKPLIHIVKFWFMCPGLQQCDSDSLVVVCTWDWLILYLFGLISLVEGFWFVGLSFWGLKGSLRSHLCSTKCMIPPASGSYHYLNQVVTSELDHPFYALSVPRLAAILDFITIKTNHAVSLSEFISCKLIAFDYIMAASFALATMLSHDTLHDSAGVLR